MSDLISRKALKAIVERHMDMQDLYLPAHFLDIADGLPTVDAVEVVHGHWVYDHWCEFKCSNCGEWSNSKPYRGRENYCPYCGAKMDEVSE